MSVIQQLKARKSWQLAAIISASLLTITIAGNVIAAPQPLMNNVVKTKSQHSITMLQRQATKKVAKVKTTAPLYPIGIYSVALNGFNKGELSSSSQVCFNFKAGLPGAPLGTQEALPTLEAKPFGSANYSFSTLGNQLNWQSVIATDNSFGILIFNGVADNQNGIYSRISGKIQDITNQDRYYTFSGNKVDSCSVRAQHW